MKKAKLFVVISVVILSAIVLLTLRSRDLTVHISNQTAGPDLNIELLLDDQVMYNGKVTPGVYIGKKIVIENVGIGFPTSASLQLVLLSR